MQGARASLAHCPSMKLRLRLRLRLMAAAAAGALLQPTGRGNAGAPALCGVLCDACEACTARRSQQAGVVRG
jgi:hypothetical protein